MDPSSTPLLHQEKTKLCFQELEKMAKAALEQRRHLAKEILLKERLLDQVQALQSAANAANGSNSSEVTRILTAASDLVKIKTQSDELVAMHKKIDQLENDLQTCRDESERVRERYREAIVSSTRSNLQTSQLREELDAARTQNAKAEKRAQQESSKVQLAMEERETFSKRCEQLTKQVNQLKAQTAAYELKHAATTQQQSKSIGVERKFRPITASLRTNSNAMEPLGGTKKRPATAAAAATSNKPPISNKRTMPPKLDDDNEPSEFDFL